MKIALALMGVVLMLNGASPLRADCGLTETGFVPLNDLGGGIYQRGTGPGHEQPGGLYPGGSNQRPAAHEAAGVGMAGKIQPLNSAGQADPNGKIVLVSIGMSNTSQEFDAEGPMSFKPRMDADPSKNPRLLLVNGAQGGQAALQWANSNTPWNVLKSSLAAAGAAPAQVQAAWIKLAMLVPGNLIPPGETSADENFPFHATVLANNIRTVTERLKSEFPNLKIAYLSSRIRAYDLYPLPGHKTINPEPFAYESGFGVRFLLEKQINGMASNFNPANGPVVAPWLSWGPYLWADGMVPRSDGLIYQCSDLDGDFVHPDPGAAAKVADQLIAHFKNDPTAAPWFLRKTIVGQPPSAAIAASATAGLPPLTVMFSASVSDPDGAVRETAWTFGDGGSSLSAAPVKFFPNAGAYTVRLTVTDDDGNTTTKAMDITVSASGPDEISPSAPKGFMRKPTH